MVAGQLRLLMWKNWRLQVRHPLQTLLEIGVPALFCAVLVAVRSLAEPSVRNLHSFDAFAANASRPIGVPLKNYTLAYAPAGDAWLATVMEHVGAALEMHRSPQGYATGRQLEKALAAASTTTMAAAAVGVVFADDFDATAASSRWEFTLRFPSELQALSSQSGDSVRTWRTNQLYPVFQPQGPREFYRPTADPHYLEEGFLAVQNLVSDAIVRRLAGDAYVIPQLRLQRFPYPSYIQDILLEVLRNIISLIIVLAFQYTSISVMKMVTTEKEKQLKEAMKIMGLPGWLHWTAWFVKSFLFMSISVVLMTVLLKTDVWYDEGVPAVLPRCNPVLLCIFLLLFVVATITLCFAISVFFTKANMAAGIGGVIFFLFMVPYSMLQMRYQELSLVTKLAASLMSNTAMAFGFQLICTFESTGAGLQWDNLFEPVTPDDNLTMAHIFLMFLIDSVLYMCIALYVEAIFPGRYGVPKKWYFIFTWFFHKSDLNRGAIPEDPGVDRSRFEEHPKGLTVGIDICGLTKVYGDTTAVNRLHLKLYEDQITVLLGHNGAGKTTTMAMLTGVEVPTVGTAVINTYDLRTQMDAVRASLGLCPQHNILFDELTVAEHIYFYGRLKGMTEKAVRQEVDDYVKLLRLEDKRNAQSRTLSGGMKRKLSVAMAFCGGSKVVMLDEPTAGMDPSARRALWELVASQKKGRTIMLTTHFMDEADLLGDRIAIMAAGELQCCGSSFFLKKRYGAGYRLIMDRLPHCDVPRVTTVLRQFIPHLEVNSNIGSELVYLLPQEVSTHFEPMLAHLEENLSEFGIASYGISLTTLEEVFMKVGADNTGNTMAAGFGLPNTTRRKTGRKLLKNQILAMLMKRSLSTIRSWQLLLLQFLIPVVLLTLAIIAGRQSATKELPGLEFTLKSYRNAITLLSTNDSTDAFYKAADSWLRDQSLERSHVRNISEVILMVTEREPATFRSSYILGTEFRRDINGTPQMLGWFNNEPYHTPPLLLNFMYNVILKTLNPRYNLRVINHPLPFKAESKFKLLQQGNNLGFQMAVNIGICMAFVSAFYVLFYVRERVCKAKHLQFVSGINVITFWAVSYAWDWCTYIITIIVLIVTLICFQEDGFKEAESIGILLLIFFYFGFAMLPFIYVLSFLYELPSTAFMRVILLGVLIGVFGLIIVEILYVESLDLLDAAQAMDWVCLFVPYYALASGVHNANFEFERITTCRRFVDACVSQRHLKEDRCWRDVALAAPQCAQRTAGYYDWLRPGIGRNIALTFIVGTLLVGLVFMLEFKVPSRLVYLLQTRWSRRVRDEAVPLDEDVVAEMAKVRGLSDFEVRNYPLVMKNTTKYYKTLEAVKGLCLAVGQSECFGLLGVNGAGKTTTFQMITGDTDISAGDVFVRGRNLKYNIKEVYKMIGYCPQFDALFDDLTGRETIAVFCLLRGYDWSETDSIAESLARRFDFLQHLDKKVRAMSGGNKRKLSTSVALIGDPPIICLDEPTTGMDPATKRHLWNALCALRDVGKCLVLTTHSMEECEALCTRLAIMVGGRFMCLGSTQRLKSRFARGLTLTVKLRKQSPENVAAALHNLHHFVSTHLQSAHITDQHQELVTFAIPASDLPWSKLFGFMERSRTLLDIEDYALGQSSLEQVFLQFTFGQPNQSALEDILTLPPDETATI